MRSNERLARARFDESTSELVSRNGLYADGVSSSIRQSLRSNERLPGDVLLARARLLERLRGVSVSANRLVLRALCKFEILFAFLILGLCKFLLLVKLQEKVNYNSYRVMFLLIMNTIFWMIFDINWKPLLSMMVHLFVALNLFLLL